MSRRPVTAGVAGSFSAMGPRPAAIRCRNPIRPRYPREMAIRTDVPTRSPAQSPLRILAAVALAMSLAPTTALAQTFCPGGCPETLPGQPSEPWMSERAQGHLTVLGVNAAIGGLTGGVRQWRGGGSFGDGFVRGALGGGVTYAGKVVVAQDAPGAGLLGRGLAATGSSITRNASDGRPSLERLILPVGPVRVRTDAVRGGLPVVSLDLVAALSTVGVMVSGMGTELAWGSTLGSGAAVFHATGWDDDWGWEARHYGGTIVLRGDGVPSERFMRRALAHERVHLLQYDQAFILWSDPVEERLLARLGLPAALDLGLHAPLFLGLNLLIPYELQPWEIEAHFVADTFDLHIH
jgi:hypothetical protein